MKHVSYTHSFVQHLHSKPLIYEGAKQSTNHYFPLKLKVNTSHLSDFDQGSTAVTALHNAEHIRDRHPNMPKRMIQHSKKGNRHK